MKAIISQGLEEGLVAGFHGNLWVRQPIILQTLQHSTSSPTVQFPEFQDVSNFSKLAGSLWLHLGAQIATRGVEADLPSLSGRRPSELDNL